MSAIGDLEAFDIPRTNCCVFVLIMFDLGCRTRKDILFKNQWDIVLECADNLTITCLAPDVLAVC